LVEIRIAAKATEIGGFLVPTCPLTAEPCQAELAPIASCIGQRAGRSRQLHSEEIKVLASSATSRLAEPRV